MPRFVVDTQVFWQGFAQLLNGQSLNAKFMRAGLLDQRYELLYSAAILQEYLETPANYPAMARRLHITAERLELTARLVTSLGRVVAVTTAVRACRDPGDDVFLACALDGHADAVVSADRDLLDMGEYEGILVLPVPMAWRLLEQSR